MIIIDGSQGEGGGQIVRTALAMSALTQKPITITNIRKGRCVSGLKAEHLACITALGELCDAGVEGAVLGSETVTFIPKHPVKARTLSLDIGTAGSITLLLQALLPVCIRVHPKVRIKVKGGTDVKWSQPVDYFREILLPVLEQYASITLTVEQRGYFPTGGGSVDLLMKPHEGVMPPISITDRGKLIQLKGVSHASSMLEKNTVAERQARSAMATLSSLNVPIDIRTEYCPSTCPGSGITLWAVYENADEKQCRIGADSLGEKGKSAEAVGKEAAERLLNEIAYGAPIDEYLADNLIPFLAFVGGAIKVSKISNHTHTNIAVVEQFLGKLFSIQGSTISSTPVLSAAIPSSAPESDSQSDVAR